VQRAPCSLSNVATVEMGAKYSEGVFKFIEGEHISGVELEQILQVPKTTTDRWRTCFADFGMTPYEWSILGKKRLKKLHKLRHSNSMSEDTITVLVDLALQSPDLYLDELQINLYNLTGAFVSASTISRTLHGKGLLFKFFHPWLQIWMTRLEWPI
jgi:hypothetical protein